MRRKRGSTLGLVAVVTVVLVIVGIGIFFLTKLLGGGRELANATDAGSLNVAKRAIRFPGQDAYSFSDQEVGMNFALLGEQPRTLNLLTYNRCVMQALIVALNAKDEGTPESAANAVKVYNALNSVGSYLRQGLESKNGAAAAFDPAAGSNSLRMLGRKADALDSHDRAFTKRGFSTNVYINPVVMQTFNTPPALPTNSTGRSSSGGFPFLTGYQPISLNVQGENLVFCGVPVMPFQPPHLISISEFEKDIGDDFATAQGQPAGALPPNSFKAGGKTQEENRNLFISAVACSVVGCLDRQYLGAVPYGYIEINNHPSVPEPKTPFASDATRKDIFAHELVDGIIANGSGPGSVFTTMVHSTFPPGDWTAWYQYNTAKKAHDDAVARGDLNPPAAPGSPPSTSGFFNSSGQFASEADCASILTPVAPVFCGCPQYTEPPEKDTATCVALLPAFKLAYRRPGENDAGSFQNNGWTNQELLKSMVLASRVGVVTCRDINAPNLDSGVKLFQHNTAYPTPGSAMNFGSTGTALQYLQMIDQVSAGCATGATLQQLVKRCQQIDPNASTQSVKALLDSKPLPMGSRLYIFTDGNALTISNQPPAWSVNGTIADGRPGSCGQPYVVDSFSVNTAQDGTIMEPYLKSPVLNCQDSVGWIPSSGYRNLLGSLSFTNTCTGGGKFCQPN